MAKQSVIVGLRGWKMVDFDIIIILTHTVEQWDQLEPKQWEGKENINKKQGLIKRKSKIADSQL